MFESVRNVVDMHTMRIPSSLCLLSGSFDVVLDDGKKKWYFL